MAIRQIVQIGEPVLRKKSKPVEKIDGKIIQLLEDMADTMYKADGVGLAAPQVGILKSYRYRRWIIRTYKSRNNRNFR